jgi:hypothetical protein
MDRSKLVAAVDAAENEFNAASRRLCDAQEELRRFDARVFIEKHNLRKSMVVHTNEAGKWISTADEWWEWLAENRPDAKWYEWNGGVYEIGKVLEQNRPKYDELPE